MALITVHTFPLLRSLLSDRLPSRPQLRTSTKVAATRRIMDDVPTKLIDFPHASDPVKELMSDLANCLEQRIGTSLLPCSLPADVQYYENPSGTAQGRLLVRSAIDDFPVDFILESWIHCKLPTGAELNISSISTFLKSSTDAPNLVVDIVQSSPTSLVVILDMPPRKDLVLYPEYLKTFYEDTGIDRLRQLLENLPEVKLYIPPFLYLRAFVSPAAILVHIEADNSARIEEIVQGHLRPAANKIMNVWLDLCASVGREVGEAEMACLARRDQVTRSKTIELDLATNLPRMFGEETAGRVLTALKQTFHAARSIDNTDEVRVT